MQEVDAPPSVWWWCCEEEEEEEDHACMQPYGRGGGAKWCALVSVGNYGDYFLEKVIL